ncbi:aldehyde reductase [Micromonosporaceae bacterium B7E4]
MRVLVTGATGFLAGHCIEELLTHGYEVRGTVRDLRTADVAHLRAVAAGTDGVLEFAEADLTVDAGWMRAVDGCDFVWHVASPFPPRLPRDENELIGPAVGGTLRLLRAAAASTVRRVVLTSSLAAIIYGHDGTRTYTEADWTEAGRADPYPKSKTLAEKAAWNFAHQSRLELVTVNPGTIIGPLLHAERPTSLELIRRMMRGQLPLVPRIGWATVDVRDLARLHRLAMQTPEAAGNRYVAAGPHLWAGDMAAALAERYRPRGYPIGTLSMPYSLLWVLGRFEPGARLAVKYYDRREQVSAAKAQKELGWTMRPPTESVTDAAESMIQHGLVPRR